MLIVFEVQKENQLNPLRLIHSEMIKEKCPDVRTRDIKGEKKHQKMMTLEAQV